MSRSAQQNNNISGNQFPPGCPGKCPEPADRCITVQQPPKLITRKKIIMVKRSFNQPIIGNFVRKVSVPIVHVKKVIRYVPKLEFVETKYIVPKVRVRETEVTRPEIRTILKKITEVRQMCQPVLYQPKPMPIDVPAAQEFCVYAVGPGTVPCAEYNPNSYQCPPCPPCLPPGTKNPCDNRNSPWVPIMNVSATQR